MNVQVASSCTAWWVSSPVGSVGSTDRARRAARCATTAARARWCPTNPRPPRQFTTSTWQFACLSPGAGSAVGRGPYIERPRNPVRGRLGIRPGSIRFHGGTSTGWNRWPTSSRSVPKPCPNSRATASSSRPSPNSVFFSPAAAWLRWAQPCCRTSACTDSSHVARTGCTSAGMIASPTVTPCARARPARRSRAGDGTAASSSRHHIEADRPSACHASSSLTRSDQFNRRLLPDITD